MRFSSYMVEQNRPSAHFYPPLTLKYVESILAQYNDIKLRLIDCHIRKYSIKEVANITQDFCPDVLVIDINFYEFSTTVNYLKLVKELNPSIVVIAIGRDPTARFSYYLGLPNLFNIILSGEVETEVVSVLNALNRGERIEDLRKEYQTRFQRKGPFLVADPDYLPFPKYDEYEMKNYRFLYPIRIKKRIKWGYILSSRGCPYQCNFCSPAIRKTSGKKVRLRKASNIVNEIEYLIDNYKINVLSFEDDNFTTVRSHVEDVCNEILKRKLRIKWIVHARIDNVDYSLLKLMKKAGCDLLRFGIESGSLRIIRLLEKATGNDWIKQSILTFSNARKLKIGTHALFMIGNPTETEEEIGATINLLKKLKPDFMQVHFFTPYPGSKAYSEFKPLLNNINLDKLYHFAQPPLAFSRVGIEDLEKWRRLFYRKFLFSSHCIINYICNYSSFYLSNPDIFCELLKMKRYIKVEQIFSKK